MTLRLDEPFRWGGIQKPESLPIPRDGMAQVAKAATGWQPYFDGRPMLSSMSKSPQKVMREAQALYHSHPWIGAAERTVTRKVAGLPWHIEDEQQEVDDDTPSPQLKVIRDLLEKPQAALPPDERQPGLTTRRGLTEIISRHMGLCGVSYVYPDQVDTDGLPLALLYVNPARVLPKTTNMGVLVGWRLDPDDYGNGGTLLRPQELIPFFLTVPDWGYMVHGLPEAAALKARITTLADMYSASTFQRSGRRSGVVAPKDGSIDNEDEYEQLVRDFREREDHPDPRVTILRGPIDFTTTDQDAEEIGVLDIGNSTRTDIFGIWGVPESQSGFPAPAGLNSGGVGDNHYEVLMSGPVHDRVVVISETFQYELLDRWQKTGINPQLVIEEPSFDDDEAPYELASKASNQPLTNNERRALLKLDPWPDYGADGAPLGLAVWVPFNVAELAQGPEANGQFGKAPTPTPPPPPAPVPPAKASERREFLGLRKSVETRYVPAMRSSLKDFLDAQRADIVSRIRNASVRQMKDASYWFRGDYWDKRLGKVLAPLVSGIASDVTTRATEVLKPAKADPFGDSVTQYVASATGRRIGGINDTTRDAVGRIVAAGLEESLTASEIADRIQDLGTFDEARAELIGRTETMFAYNTSALKSYDEYGVKEVQAIDGDQDEACAQRDGRTFTLAESMDIEDHPNGTLDWIPVMG